MVVMHMDIVRERRGDDFGSVAAKTIRVASRRVGSCRRFSRRIDQAGVPPPCAL